MQSSPPRQETKKKLNKIRLQKFGVLLPSSPPSIGSRSAKLCPRCRTSHVTTARFCMHCGIPLRQQAHKPSRATQPPSEHNIPPSQEKQGHTQPSRPLQRQLWYERPAMLLFRALFFLSLIAVLGNITHGSLSFSGSPATAQKSATALTAMPIRPLHTWKTTQTFSGNDTQQTDPFLVGMQWRIVWHCNPASVEGSDYLLMIEVDLPDGRILDKGVETLCQQQNTQGVEEEYGAGQVSLKIICIGEWDVQVQVWEVDTEQS